MACTTRQFHQPRRLLLAAVAAISTTISGAQFAQSQSPESWLPEWPTVAITAIVETADLDAVRDGIRDGLAAAGFIPGESLNFHYESARADPRKAEEIAERLAASTADVVVALTEPIARIVVQKISDRPVFLTAISGDLAQEILEAARGRTNNVAGLVLNQPLREQLQLARALSADLPKIVVPFNAGSPASRSVAMVTERLGEELAIPVQILPIAAAQEIGVALRPHAKAGVTIFLPEGSGLASSTTNIAALANEFEIVFIAGTSNAVAEGATATVLHDPYSIGIQAAAAVSRILEGAKPRDIALRPAEATYVIVNRPALELLDGIDQQRFLTDADLIYE